jgi:hypothetical protein
MLRSLHHAQHLAQRTAARAARAARAAAHTASAGAHPHPLHLPRYFLKQIATRIVNVEHQKLKDFKGDYEYYLSQNDKEAAKMEVRQLGMCACMVACTHILGAAGLSGATPCT